MDWNFSASCKSKVELFTVLISIELKIIDNLGIKYVYQYKIYKIDRLQN